MIRPTLLILGVMCLLVGFARAAPALRLCMPDTSFPPYLSADPNKPGQVDRLLLASAEAVGLSVQIQRQPPARCRKSMEDGLVDVAPMSPLPANTSIADLPMRGDRIDPAYRIASIPVLVVRRRGETAWQWDGERFLKQVPRVGVKRGIQAFGERLGRMGLSFDDAAFSSDQLLRKLEAGRIDVALMSRGEFELMQAEMPRALEALPQPFFQLELYLGVSRRSSAAQRARVAVWWEELARRQAAR